MSIEKEIYDTAIGDGMPVNMANNIVSQSKHETANYTSNAYIKDNNLFGYKYVAGAKWQVGSGIISTENDPYAKYRSIQDSVHELCDWIKRRQKQGKFPQDLTNIDPTDYAVLLKNCGYFGDTLKNYVAGLTHYYSDYSNIA